MVLLLHNLRDGSSHYDWMIQRPASASRSSGAAEGGLITFRITDRIDLCGVAKGGKVVDFLAERIGDHRPEYLTFEGELTGGRGSVRRIAAGEVLALREGEGFLEVEGKIGESRGVFRGRAVDGGWRFHFEGARRGGGERVSGRQ